jgi:hypothetical protein
LERACRGSQLDWCDDDAGDRGIDCADFGAMRCSGFPTVAHPEWVACVAESDGGACAPDASVSCTGDGWAESCPSGVPEAIDCRSLLGLDGACAPGALAPPFDWTSPCVASPEQCTTDSCDGGLTGCWRGAPFYADCAGEGLGPCRMVTADPGAEARAACTPPPLADR